MYLRKTNHPDRCVSTRRLGRVPDMEATDTNNPNLNYGLVVDCGSSGSRVFVYTWPRHNGNPHELLDIKQMRDKHRKPVVMKIKPGNFFYQYVCFLGIDPTTFAMLTQCSTTEPQEQLFMTDERFGGSV